MSAFAVKHIVEEQGPLFSIMEAVRRQPYSLTSKEREAKLSAMGCNVYVIEVIIESTKRIYRLGYRYRAWECYEGAGGALWKDRFKFKNMARPDAPEGVYFDRPPAIDDSDFNEWYRRETLGMIEIPERQVAVLEQLIADPENNAKPFCKNAKVRK